MKKNSNKNDPKLDLRVTKKRFETIKNVKYWSIFEEINEEIDMKWWVWLSFLVVKDFQISVNFFKKKWVQIEIAIGQ